MSEPRRIEVMSAAAVGVSADKTKARMTTTTAAAAAVVPTVRLSVPLTESTDDAYPEFSYVELLGRNSSEALQGSSLDPNDPFAAQDQAEHDKLAAIAKSFDSKYGAQPGKRNHASVLEDFIDLGDGYEEDSFVDNSEAYDELVPSTMRTKFGGFYINSGELDFVHVDDHHCPDGQMSKKKAKKRKIIGPDGDKIGGLDRKKKVLKMKENGNESFKKKQKKLNTEDGKRFKGPPGRSLKSDKCKTVADFLNEASHTSNIKATDGSPNLPVSPTHKTLAPGIEKLIVLSPTLVGRSLSISTDQKDRLLDDDAAVIEPKVEPIAVKTEQNISSIDSSIDAVILKSREEAMSEKKEAASESTPQSLPNSIPAELIKVVERMKELALAGKVTSDESSLVHRFTNESQQLLSEIHESLSKLQQHDRVAVYSYLGCYFPSGKEGLIKRVKKLDLTLHGDQLKQPVAKLKEAIQAVMPTLIERHRVEVTAKEKLRMDQLQEQKEKREPKDGLVQSDSDDDEENRDTAEKQRRIVAPRKKFEWNAEIRKLLCRVVDIKMEHYEMSKIQSQTPEDYLKSFLEAEIKPLWPPGWMQMRMLFKESRSSHNRWTSSIQKMKKSALVFPKTSAPLVTTPLVTTPLDASELGLGHHQTTNLSFNTPVSVPGTKMKLLLEEALAGSHGKLQESSHQVASSTAAETSATNGMREDPSGEVLFTSISSKAANRYEPETNRNNDWEGDFSLQKLRKGLLAKSLVVVQETDGATKYPAALKLFNVERRDAIAEASDLKVVNVSSSTGSDASSVISKAKYDPVASSPGDIDDVERLSANSVQKSVTPASTGNPFNAQDCRDDGLNFSSKKSSSGCGEGQPADGTRSILQEQLCKVTDRHNAVSHQLSTALPIEQFVRLNSGKSSDVTSIAQDLTARFTELRSLQRQSSSDAGSQANQIPVSASLPPDSGCLDLKIAASVGHRVPDASAQHVKQESSGAVSSNDPSGLILSKTLGQSFYKMASLAQQKSPVAFPGNSASRGGSKGVSTPAVWSGSVVIVDDKTKNVVDASKSLPGGHLPSGNSVPRLSPSGHGPLYMPKDMPPRPLTAGTVASPDRRTIARIPPSRSSAVSSEEVAKVPLRFSKGRQNLQNEDASKTMVSEELLRHIPPDRLQSILESCHNSHGLVSKLAAAEARPPFDAGSAGELAKHIYDQSRLMNAKTSAITTSGAQSSWRQSDKIQTVSPHVTSACATGYRVGQQPNLTLGDKIDAHGQHHAVKTSIPSSSHDLIQMADAVRFSGSHLQHSTSSMITCQPPKTLDSQSSQHRCQ